MLHATLSLTGILVVLTAVPIFGQDADTRGDVRHDARAGRGAVGPPDLSAMDRVCRREDDEPASDASELQGF